VAAHEARGRGTAAHYESRPGLRAGRQAQPDLEPEAGG
jgi:hypothetical protein